MQSGSGPDIVQMLHITDLYAKAVQEMTPEDAVCWAESELKRIYEA